MQVGTFRIVDREIDARNVRYLVGFNWIIAICLESKSKLDRKLIRNIDLQSKIARISVSSQYKTTIEICLCSRTQCMRNHETLARVSFLFPRKWINEATEVVFCNFNQDWVEDIQRKIYSKVYNFCNWYIYIFHK